MKAYLIRVSSNEKQTLGYFVLFNEEDKLFECVTMELAWKNNQHDISCIPNGTYKVVQHVSPTKGKCFHILNVPDRSNILIHKGNYNKDTLGCILVGKKYADINNDGLKDITSSKNTLDLLIDLVDTEFSLKIIG